MEQRGPRAGAADLDRAGRAADRAGETRGPARKDRPAAGERRPSIGRWRRWGALWGSLALLPGCAVGPAYERPSSPTPPAYKELTPADAAKTGGWVVAQPMDGALHGQWWEMYQDPELNELEERVNLSNQSIRAAFAAFEQARALAREARAEYFPTLSVNPAVTVSRPSSTLGTPTLPGTSTDFALPFDATWTPDLWGRIRRAVEGGVAAAQASAADLENARLTAQAELAVDYFSLRSQDALQEVLDSTVTAYRESLKLTQALYETGIDSEEAVAQAETQLDTAAAAATNVGLARAQYEHAIALLVGEPASTFAVAKAPYEVHPPAIPLGVPSQLLERRPDVAAGERLVAQANAQIGLATSAYYPSLTLSGSAGVESGSLANLFTWPSRFWSVGASLAETLFDAGLRRATLLQARAAYDETVANYRQTVLTAFQQVEDNLAALRVLAHQIDQQVTAVKAAEHYLALATDRYQLGIDPYLNVIAAQTALLGNQQALVALRMQQMTSSVQLIEALGGGWEASAMPSPGAVLGEEPQDTRARPSTG